MGQYKFRSENYVEARFGASWIDSAVTADFTALYSWHILDKDWTAKAGKWFFDAGCGVNVGGRAGYAYLVAGMARLGFTFKKPPISLSLDYTPVIGPAISKGGAMLSLVAALTSTQELRSITRLSRDTRKEVGEIKK